VRILLISLLLLGATGFAPGNNALPPQSSSSHPAFLYTVAKRYEPLAWMDGEERFGSGASVFIQDAARWRPLVPDFVASADPTVSFDGKSALFAGKQRASDAWQIWEISLEGGELKRITNCPKGCVRPLNLPEDRIVYAEKVAEHFVIESVALAGGKPLPLTYGLGNSLPTDVLQDGRVLFETVFPLGSNALPELYTVYSDGSGVESYRCDHGQARHSGKQVASGDIVFPSERGMARFTSALAKQVPIAAPPGEYADGIAESATGEWLLPWRANGNSQFQLMWWKPGQGTFRPALQEQEADANVLQPVLVAERSTPKRHPSALHDWPVGNLLCLNAYTSKYKFEAASIHSVRLYTRDATSTAQLLGTAPVEPDGSFFVQVPGDAPLQIELLDSRGKTLKRESGWFWMRRGEQRACVGCHAGPETSPENAVPMVLLKSTTPADMTHPLNASSAGGH
jgi:hypothetical protein